MVPNLEQQVTVLQTLLTNQTTPKNRPETLRLTAEALEQTLGEVRLLFYLSQPPSDIEPLDLVPCLAWKLKPNVFIHDTSTGSISFSFQTDHPQRVTLRANSHRFGLIFMERVDQALTRTEEVLAALIASQTAHHLAHLSISINGNGTNSSKIVDLDLSRRQIWVNNRSVQLTALEFTTFDLLYRNQGYTCSRELIYQTIYNNQVMPPSSRQDRLDLVIYKLREKLKQIEAEPIQIKTIRGLGYRLEQILRK